MRIGIITFWNSNDNYGQQLQCFALQMVLKQLGHDPFLIRYIPRVRPRSHSLFFLVNFIKSSVKFIFNIRTKDRKFYAFRKMNFIQTRFYFGIEDIRLHPPVADCYITGSDQVWSMLLNDINNKSYYLDFGASNVKRISYAASFGMKDYPSDLLDNLRQCLDRFDNISVREKDGVNICNSLGIKASCVLDPTMLLNIDYYKSLFKKKRCEYYVYIYHLNILTPEDLCWNELYNNIASNKLVCTVSSGKIVAKEILPNVEYVYPEIQEWLSLIFYSSLFITTSFHGVVFSILFHKKFAVFPLRDSFSYGNNRIYDLLTPLGLEYRIINDSNSISSVISTEIDWADVDSKLLDLKNESFKFILNSLI